MCVLGNINKIKQNPSAVALTLGNNVALYCINYDTGWKKDVVKHCLELASL